MRPESIAAILIIGLSPGVLGVRAAQAEGRDPAAAEVLFREGRRLMKEREYTSACAKLAESYRLDPAPGTLLNLGECEDRLGRTASAWEHFRAAADQLAGDDRRRAAALERANTLERGLPRLTVTLVATAPEDTEVTRDGVVLGTASLGVALPLDPGRHLLRARAAGHEPREVTVELRPAERRTVALEPGPALPAPAVSSASAASGDDGAPKGSPASSAAAQPPATTPRRAVVGYVLWAGSALALGGGVYFGLQARAARADAAASCASGGGNTRCWSDARDALDRDSRDSVLADIGFGLGLASAAIGTYLVFRAGKPEETDVQGSATLRHIALVPLGRGAALSAGGTF